MTPPPMTMTRLFDVIALCLPPADRPHHFHLVALVQDYLGKLLPVQDLSVVAHGDEL